MRGALYIGTSGWNYPSWRATFYEGQSASTWLRFAANRFTAVEVNATFYRLQSVETFKRWAETTPPRFRFAIKANRYLTHNKKLIDPLPSIRLDRDRALGIGEKLCAVVWQLPRRFQRNLERLEAFAQALREWPVRHAIEFRHVSWFADEVAACLAQHNIAVCQSDAADWPMWDAVTTDMVYIRLHGHDVTYVSCYSPDELKTWAAKVRRWRREGRDVHVYFDNDAHGHAPYNAMQLLAMLRR